jgi:hypothetical protein
MILVYTENHTKPIIQNAELLIVKAGGTYSYHWALKKRLAQEAGVSKGLRELLYNY